MNKPEAKLYIRVRNQLAEDIENGVLKPNDSLPSERQLSERFEVSRMTARQALIQLEKEGLAYTNGTRSRFVAEPVMEYNLSKTISFFASSAHGNNDLRISVLEQKTVTASDEQCQQLDVPIGSEIHFYSRLCSLGDSPAFIEQEYVLAERFPELWKHDIAQPILSLFDREYGVRSVRDHVVITQRAFGDEIATHLGLEKNAIGLILEQTVFDEKDRPISFGYQFWRGDMARFSADLKY